MTTRRFEASGLALFGLICVLFVGLPFAEAVENNNIHGSNSEVAPGPVFEELDSVILALIKTGAAAYEKKEFERAITAFEQIVSASRVKPLQARTLAEVLRRLGRALEDRAKIQGATVAYDVALRALLGNLTPEFRDKIEELSNTSKRFSSTVNGAIPDLYRFETRETFANDSKAFLALELLINSGNAYAKQQQYEAARQRYSTALARDEIVNLPRLNAYALANLAWIDSVDKENLPSIDSQEKRWEAAEQGAKKAIALLESLGDPRERRRAQLTLAGIYMARNTPKTEEMFNAVLALYKDADDLEGMSKAYAGLGEYQILHGRCSDAEQSFKEAITRGQAFANTEVREQAYFGIGRCQVVRGDLDKGIAAFRESLSLTEARRLDRRTDQSRSNVVESTQPVINAIVHAYLSKARSDPRWYSQALTEIENARSRALGDLMRNWNASARPTLEQLRLETCDKNPVADSQALDDPNLATQATRGTPALLADSPEQSSPATPIPPAATVVPPGDIRISDDVAKKESLGIPVPPRGNIQGAEVMQKTKVPTETIKPITRLVYYVLEDETAILVVDTSGAVNGHVMPFGKDHIDKAIFDLRTALLADKSLRGIRNMEPAERTENRSVRPYREQLKELYGVLIKPAEEFLERQNGPLLIEPHGSLWLLPFAALLSDDNKWASDKWPLLFAPSHSVFEEAQRVIAKEGHGALVVGNPIGKMQVAQVKDSGQTRRFQFEPLVGAELEAREIAGLFKKEQTKLLLNDAATLPTVLKNGGDYGVLHFATHGFADTDDPLKSFVLLAPSHCGDQLTGAHVLTLRLNADLVTLSACQTGLGKIMSGDGVVGLSRSFLLAGARSVLVSQWNVSDSATRSLMTHFYRRYLSEGRSKALALQSAMQSVRAENGFEDPSYWAPFYIIGAD